MDKSKADKMFEELGYEKKTYKTFDEEEWLEFVNDWSVAFVFNLTLKEISAWRMSEPYHFNCEEHLAIHEKIKELGWLDE